MNGKRFGPNIVRAWFDTVFLHVLRGLARQRGFLQKQNWTYRFHTQSLEYVAPVEAYLPFGAEDNLEQLVSFFPELQPTIATHDEAVANLTERCRELHKAILADPEFEDSFAHLQSHVPTTLGRPFVSFFGALSEDGDIRSLLAEYLVNNLGALPGHYATAEVWNRYGENLKAALSGPFVTACRDRSAEAGSRALAAGNQLEEALRETRSHLSLEFDVPYFAEAGALRS